MVEVKNQFRRMLHTHCITQFTDNNNNNKEFKVLHWRQTPLSWLNVRCLFEQPKLLKPWTSLLSITMPSYIFVCITFKPKNSWEKLSAAAIKLHMQNRNKNMFFRCCLVTPGCTVQWCYYVSTSLLLGFVFSSQELSNTVWDC